MTPTEILDFIKNSPVPVNKRDIAQALKLKGVEQRVELKTALRALVTGGAVAKMKGGMYSVPDGLPNVCILHVVEIDLDGDVLLRPADWDDDVQGDAPRIELMPDKKYHPAPAVGDRVLARLKRAEDGIYEAKTIRVLNKDDRGQVIGLLRITSRGGILQPANKKAKHDFDVQQKDLNGAEDGDLVVGEIQSERGMKRKTAKIVEVLGSEDDPKAISLLSLHEAGIKEPFPDAVIKETDEMKVPAVGKREDLRDIPLVTIDGADARDFDDAVFAEKRDDGGFHLIVAIADVAHYVRSHGIFSRPRCADVTGGVVE